MILIKLKALFKHQLCSFYILLIIISIFSNFIIKISINNFLLIGWSSFTLYFLINKFLKFNCQFNLFSGFLI